MAARVLMLRLVVIVGVLATVAASGSVATAADGSARASNRRLVAAFLAAHPGGVVINDTEIAYNHGRVIVTVVPPRPLVAADCPSGWFCFYDGVNFAYPRGRLSDCGWQDLGWWGWRNRTESAAYALSSGSVVFINETGETDTALFTISTTRRSIADVGSARNRADYVFRYC